MNVLVVPSWYPHRCFPLEGAYVRDQARCLAETRPAWSVGLALWHQGRNHLSLAHLADSPRCALDALVDRAPREHALAPNLVEWTEPALLFPERLFAGGREGIVRSLRRVVARVTARFGRPDVLHAHVAYPAGWAAMRVSAETGIPYIVTEHMGPFPLPVYRRPDGRLADFIREPLARAHARIAVSPALATAMEAHGIGAVEVVPNVVDERAYVADTSGEPGRFTFFTVCQMVRTKGIAELLDAAAALLARLDADARARVRFRIAGTGPDLPAFRARSRALHLDAHVEWIEGYMSHERTRREFASCDAFVLPSHFESFGIVFVEAMACGKPSVATRCGGPESILGPESGVLVAVGDVPALTDALEHMVRNAHTYDRAAIRAAFERRYGRAAVAGALERVYARVTGAAPTGGGAR